jgi:dipeptidyl aminopeptidase/acylaminoacyl peptidase
MRNSLVIASSLYVLAFAWQSSTVTAADQKPTVELTAERAVHFRRVTSLSFSPDSTKLVAVVAEQDGGSPVSHLWMLRVSSPMLSQLTFSAKIERAPEWSADGQTLAFLSNRAGATQVYLLSTDGGEAHALTSGENVQSFHWSPDGKTIAYLANETPAKSGKNGDAIVADDDQLPRLWSVDIASGKSQQITRAQWRIDEFAWLDDAHVVAIATDRPRQETWNTALYNISLRDGSFALASRPGLPFEGLRVSPNRKTLAISATRSGGPIAHDLYLKDVTAGAWRNATSALDRPVQDVKWQGTATPVVRVLDGFHSTLYRVTEAKAVALKLPYSVGSFDVARDGTLAFSAVAFNRLPEVYLQSAKQTALQVSHLNQSWDDVRLSDAEIFRFKSFDGLEIEAALMKPVQKSAVKQPLVLLVHGGPASSFTADYFWFNAWPQLLVARGYQVLMVNPRGSVGYGEDFVKANRADWGGGDFKDLMQALDKVLARGEVDPARLGIGGWSFGGEMSEWAITQTDRFKAAVVGAGVFDQSSEFGTEDDPAYDEWYFGTPWEHPEIFARNSPSTYIRNAKTPTLIFHGANDRSNPIGQSIALYRALKHLNVECQFVTYPRENHLPREELHQIDIMQRMLDWFDRHLAE